MELPNFQITPRNILNLQKNKNTFLIIPQRILRDLHKQQKDIIIKLKIDRTCKKILNFM